VSLLTGYENFEDNFEVVALINENGPQQIISTDNSGPVQFEVILNQTPFYPESGGQLSDQGELWLENGTLIKIEDVQKPAPGLIVHYGTLESGSIAIGDQGIAKIDINRRKSIAKAHTSTHLIHKALQEQLGEQTTQAGSENSENRVRFDIHANEKISDEKINEVETRVNQQIAQNLLVQDEIMDLESAKKQGAQALFGEKYGNRVRVVTIGDNWSKELCGGTHVSKIGEIGLVSIVSESALGSGVRRIDALVSNRALEKLNREKVILNQLNGLLKTNSDNIITKIESLIDQVQTSEKKLQQFSKSELLGQVNEVLKNVQTIKDINLYAVELSDVDSNLLKDFILKISQTADKSKPGILLIGNKKSDSIAISITTINDPNSKVNANQLIQLINPIIDGKGGGKSNFAQAGGKNMDSFKKVEAEIVKVLQSL